MDSNIQKLEDAFKKMPSGTIIEGTIDPKSYDFVPDFTSLEKLNQKRFESSLFREFQGTVEGMDKPTIKGFISKQFLRKRKETKYGLDYQGLMKIGDLLGRPAEILTLGFIKDKEEILYDDDDMPLDKNARRDARGFVYYTGACDIHGNPKEWCWVTTQDGQKVGMFLDSQRTQIKIGSTVYSMNEYGEIQYNPFLNDEEKLSR